MSVRKRLEALEGRTSEAIPEDVERSVGAVAGQLLNGARACVRDALTAREQEELIERLEALESSLEQKRGGGRWGA